ncbi:NAD(P)H-binding protein [Streptomyces flavofungini]|uniref:NAD(P)H-binding protein n=1 Tax=Streptomyces flavofungini TaxID=68200 RepID=A0ABS0XB49_9ACTN|nr:NAD(P)H-binding protein [Streptomyces flavofungini]MBJ3810448.1 NAD(P)H-binding protein [Streptomyces flavofungini]GHC41962.1 oxidoreductase [Streptomyces flavofungini]
MPERHTILVTGAGGTTGSRVTARLVALGHTVRAASRSARTPHPGARAVRFDWYDEATHAPALHGADRVYLVAPVGDPDPAAVMLPFLRRARAAGVRRVALLSSSAIEAGGPALGQVHQLLAEEGLFEEWAVLRPSWFMQNFTAGHLHAESVRTDGVLTTATGTGRVPFVDADDIAAVAVHALTALPAPEHDLVITGPEALTYDEVAAILTRATGRTVTHHPVSADRLAARLTELGIPAGFARILAALDDSIRGGAEDRVTDTVARLTNRAPRAFADYCRDVWSRSTVTDPSR